MRIPSGVTDQYIYFVAVDATNFTTRETGLSGFTVYRSRNGGIAAAMTTPTVNETDTTNMPGVYELLLDEDMTIAAGNDSEEMAFHITVAGMAPVTRTIELYRPKITAGNTLDVTATGAAGIDWGNVENQATAVDLSATDIQLCDTITTYTGNTPQTGDGYAIVNHVSYGNAQLVRSTTPANTLDVNATGAAGIDWANVDGQTSVVTLNNTTVGTTTTNTDMRGTDNALLAASAPTNFGDMAITVTTGQVTVGTNNDKTGYTASTVTDKTGYSISGTKTTLDALNDIAATAIVSGGAINTTTGAVDTVTTVTNRVTANSDQINGSADGANRLSKATQCNVFCTVGSASTTTSIVTSAMDPAAAAIDQFKGKIVTFDANTTTANLRGQSTDITGNTALGVLAVTALTDAPVSGDTFVIT